MIRVAELFAGYGGLGMGVAAAIPGAELAWYSEFDPAPSRIMTHHHPGVPNHGDVTAIDWTAVERPDILTGGFPCQDVSVAGRRAGMVDGTRSGLWSHMAHAIDQLRPALVVIENVGGLFSAQASSVVESHPLCLGDDGSGSDTVPLRALSAVLSTLSELGYDAQWTAIRASDVGAPHGRLRVFITAHPAGHPFAPHPGGSGSGRGPEGPESSRSHHAPIRPDQGSDGGRDHVRLMPTPRTTDMNGGGHHGTGGMDLRTAVTTSFGPYQPAIARWEAVLGRPAPAATEPGKTRPRLSAAFVEWLMGLPDGHVTGVPGLTRAQQLKALGNGVVPQQAAAALTHLAHLSTL